MEQVKNEKTFFEVFPTLRADGELKMLFQDVEVKKITTNSTREFLHIHMVSHHLIPKKVIWKMEQSIKEQLFGTASVAIQIEEVSVKSDYYLNTNHEYEVCCQIVENGFSLIDLKLTVPTESEAEAIAGNWASQSQDIYTLLLTKLL